MDPNEVVLRVYDVSRGMAAMMSHALLGQSLEGVWHSGVEVFGTEYFFGGGGVARMSSDEFEREYNIKAAKVLPLGRTEKTKAELDEYVRANATRFTTSTYDLLSWNCNHFADLLVRFLLPGKSAPEEIVNQHELIKRSPVGAMIIEAISKMSLVNPIGTTQSLERSTEFAEAARRFRDQFEDQFVEVYKMLEKLASNLITNSTREMYRQIRSDNPRLKAVFHAEEARQLLELLGFQKQPDGSFYAFPPPNAANLKELIEKRNYLRAELVRANAAVFPVSANNDPMASAASFAAAAAAATGPVSSTPAGSSDGAMGGASAQNLYPVQMTQLYAMGFTDVDKCLEALRAADGNLNRALDKLIQ